MTGFGTPSEERVVEINHDGTGHWGQMKVEDGGRVLSIGTMRFGGKLPDFYRQDFRTLDLDDARSERSRIYIGDEGALFFFGIAGGGARFVRISNKPGKPVMHVRGDIDLPGILLGGRVNPSGEVDFDHIWGVKASTARVERIGGGTYRITHNFGHSRYSVICTEQGNGRHNANWGNVTDNSFDVYTYYDNTKYSDIPFSFIVVGDNY